MMQGERGPWPQGDYMRWSEFKLCCSTVLWPLKSRLIFLNFGFFSVNPTSLDFCEVTWDGAEVLSTASSTMAGVQFFAFVLTILPSLPFCIDSLSSAEFYQGGPGTKLGIVGSVELNTRLSAHFCRALANEVGQENILFEFLLIFVHYFGVFIIVSS